MDTIFTDGQLTKAMETMRQKGMNPDRFNRLLSSGIFADICDPNACLDDRDSVRKALRLGVALPENIPLSVDYGQSLEQMIAAGNYDWKNDDITAKKFPVVGEGIEQFETRVVHFNRTISSEEAVEAIKNINAENPLEPAKIEHLLAFGAKYPEEQRKYPIIALGSVAEVLGDRGVPYLGRDDARRILGLHWWDFDWDDYYRFLAVRKLSSAT
ncbi:MAG: hypothetical protein V4474_02720 [Patescibacteria group bacterium]